MIDVLEPKIVHLSFSNNVNDHFEYMRRIASDCYGKHIYSTFDNIPKADLYITEHFMSTNKAIQNFLYKNKTINVVHSMKCIPTGNFICNIALTDTWARHLKKRGVKNIRVIPGGIDLKPYKDIRPEQDKKIFGRITRWSEKKIPDWWNGMVKEILNENISTKCLMFIDVKSKRRKFLDHKRMIYDQSCRITDFKGAFLKRLMVYVHANGQFREILSNSTLEAMATGLPIVYLKEASLNEIVDYAGIKVNNKRELKEIIIEMFNDKKMRMAYSELSRLRITAYDLKYTLNSYNKLIKECL